jgi:Fic family protein
MDKITKYDTIALKDRLKVDWTYTSNAIEGNTISLGDTAYIIQYGLTIKGKSIAQHNEVIGHAKAIDLVYNLIKQDTISEDDIFLLHKAVQANLVIDIECPIGAYKVIENGRYVKFSDDKTDFVPYPYPNDISYLMELWFNEFSKIEELDNFDRCVEVYTNMHIGFTAIHPFFDGNGRLARLISNIPLLKSNYLPIIINNEDRTEYIRLLSNYNIKAKPLDNSSKNLVEKNEEYKKLKEFFKDQYKNTSKLLETIRRTK